MAFVKVEDTSGNIDLIVFPSIYRRTRGAWIENKPVIVVGKKDIKDESFNIIVEDVKTQDDIFSKEYKLRIKIPKYTKKEVLYKVKRLLLKNPGAQKVTLQFEGNGKSLDLNILINWNEELAKQISGLLSYDTDS